VVIESPTLRRQYAPLRSLIGDGVFSMLEKNGGLWIYVDFSFHS
jgi:hypothetical protein